MSINRRSTLGRMGLVLALSMLYQSLFSQSLLSGFGAEIGAGYNQVFAKALLPVPPDVPSESNRDGFSPIPTVRLKYEIEVFGIFDLVSFISYNRFGGRSAESNGYKDEFWFDALDAGLFATYPFGPVEIGPGVKVNRFLNVTGRYFGGADGPVWVDNDMSWLFRKWSYDAAIRVSYVFMHWNLAAESWFGISGFQKPDLDGKGEWRENHFRLLVGYTL